MHKFRNTFTATVQKRQKESHLDVPVVRLSTFDYSIHITGPESLSKNIRSLFLPSISLTDQLLFTTSNCANLPFGIPAVQPPSLGLFHGVPSPGEFLFSNFQLVLQLPDFINRCSTVQFLYIVFDVFSSQYLVFLEKKHLRPPELKQVSANSMHTFLASVPWFLGTTFYWYMFPSCTTAGPWTRLGFSVPLYTTAITPFRSTALSILCTRFQCYYIHGTLNLINKMDAQFCFNWPVKHERCIQNRITDITANLHIKLHEFHYCSWREKGETAIIVQTICYNFLCHTVAGREAPLHW